MHGFELLLGHLLGDYILQNDWMAANKANPAPLRGPALLTDPPFIVAQVQQPYAEQLRRWWVGHLACTIHCLLYTVGVGITCWEWFPLWGYAAVFLAHWPIDRWRLAVKWMQHVSGQGYFSSSDHPMFPWSIVSVDNIFHLLTLWAIVKLDAVLPYLQTCLHR